MSVLPSIQKSFNRHGGRVVLFQRVTSVFIVSWERTYLEWIPPYSTRTWFGLRHALWTALVGWWSLSGLWCAPAAILTNIFGGVDVTELVKSPLSLPSCGESHPIAKAEAVLRNRGYYMLILEMFLLFGGIMLFIAYAPAKWLTQKP
jgi:vacuolar-type H+-ATPase subunit I/STV1